MNSRSPSGQAMMKHGSTDSSAASSPRCAGYSVASGTSSIPNIHASLSLPNARRLSPVYVRWGLYSPERDTSAGEPMTANEGIGQLDQTLLGAPGPATDSARSDKCRSLSGEGYWVGQAARPTARLTIPRAELVGQDDKAGDRVNGLLVSTSVVR